MKQLRRMNKKGQVLASFNALAVGLVALAITLAVAFLIMSNLAANSEVAADANATKAVSLATNAAAQVPTFLGIVAITLIGGVLIFLVTRAIQTNR